MTDYVNPSNNFRPYSEEMGAVFRYAGHAPAYIADTNSTLVSDVDSVGVTDGPLGAFAKVSTSGLDFTIDTGEAMIEGALLARDTQTTLSLPASSSGTIYLAWDPSVEAGLIIDTGASGNVSGLPQTPLYDFTTDGSSVTGDTNRREVGEHISVRNDRYETSDGSGASVDQADNASSLGGAGANSYARLGQDETVTGNWTMNGALSLAGNPIQDASSIASGSYLMDNAGYGFNFGLGGSNDERPFIAPYVNGSSKFSREITWNDGADQWEIEGHVALTSGTMENERGVNVVTGDPDQCHIFQGDGSPSDSLGQKGDLYVEY